MQMQDEYEPEEESPEMESDEQLGERVQALGYRLKRLAEEQIGIRQMIEDRWLADLEQYMGRYDAETLSRLARSNGSQAFVNITRAKTTAAESRLSDMLFPTDDKNWGIQPTPVPELQAMANNHGLAGVDESGAMVTHADIAAQELKLARKRAEGMENEIDDQLIEAKYHQIARDVIHDACLFGTGILKGPVVINRTRNSWKKLDGSVYELSMVQDYRPGVEHVKVWDWFPDMSAVTMDECGFIFERRYISKKQLIELSKRPGYLQDQIRRVIAEAPEKQVSSHGGTHVARLREMSGVQVNVDDNRFELWEYHGPVKKEDLEACGCEVDDDELEEHDVIVTLVNGRVIKADLNPLETGERPYSVFCYEDDDTTVFGFGVPYLLRNEQRIVNAAWRMTLDNAALSTGPQIVVNRELVIPSDGAWDLKPKKLWWMSDPDRSVNEVFATHEISSHQAELTQIFDMARNMADDVTSLPMLAQGEKGDAPDTASGMSMLMNSANVVLRRVVKSFDDGITKPFIHRMYDWNMQNSDKEDIKGDFEVDARGSSALLVKETQTHALMNLMITAQQPIFSELTKHAELYRKAVQAQHITPDDIVKTNEEIEAEKNKPNPQQQQQQQMFALQLKELQAKIDKLQAESVTKNIEGLYSSMQTAEIVATMPSVAPIADDVSKSAGFIDRNGYPLVNQQPVTQPGTVVPTLHNTDPRFPANPQSPATGMMHGIETQANDG